MATEQSVTANPLVLESKALDTSLNVQLHPLVLLTISDYITRHTLRQQQGPVIGAVIGQQSGRSFTLEHAYECKTDQRGDDVLLDDDWFGERLEQYRDVHKAPALDLVAMFMMAPVAGPQTVHLPVLRQVQQITGNDSVMLLLFHAELVDQLQGGKLPISLYETITEQEGELKFRPLSFEVETGEAEMISVDSVATGGGNATAVPKAEASQAAESSKKDKAKSKGKAKDKDKDKDEPETNGEATASVLSPEDEELIASLNAKANAIKMLNQRINLIRSYLTELPSSYLTDASSKDPPPENTNHTLLRSINSMLSRLPLLAPPAASTPVHSDAMQPVHQTPSNLDSAASKEQADVHLTSLLAALTRATSEAQNMGSKFHIVAREKANKERVPYGGGGSRGRFGGDEGILGESAGEF